MSANAPWNTIPASLLESIIREVLQENANAGGVMADDDLSAAVMKGAQLYLYNQQKLSRSQ